MLYAHGSDLCHELELRHAMANCFEALMGALLLDGGIEVADKVFANTLFMENSQLKEVRTWYFAPEFGNLTEENFSSIRWIRYGWTIHLIRCKIKNQPVTDNGLIRIRYWKT